MFCICVVLSQVTRRFTVMFTTLDHRKKEKDRKKENAGDRPAKLNEKKSDRELEPEIKNKGDFFMEEQHEQFKQFAAAVRK